ncbi:GyrI-like domain-containing protein [Thiobacter aerophilum]|uniref:GyrI-like domain-containing protein n=1 Tax=Thiobacter aerophilum TaxID=3121275 RepID=A0ABV0EGR3_9BURK
MLKKNWLIILLAFVLPLIAVFAWWGGFNSVEISEAERGPYRFAYLEHTGDYARLPETQARVRALMAQQNLARGAAITVLLDDPRTVPKNQLRARTGYLIAPSAQPATPLRLGEIPTRRVLVARVRAAALLAPSKAYQALHDHLAAQHTDIRMPTVEIYDSPPEVYRIGELSVEMER